MATRVAPAERPPASPASEPAKGGPILSVSHLGKASDTAQMPANTIHNGLRSGSKFCETTLYGSYV